MFVTISDMKSSVPTSHLQKVREIENWLTGHGINVTKPFPTAFIIATQSKSDFEWVNGRVAHADPTPEQASSLMMALTSVNKSKADKVYGSISGKADDNRAGKGSATKIVANFTKADIEKVATEYAKFVKAGTPKSATKSADAVPMSVDVGSNANVIDPTNRQSLLLALLNFTGKPVEEIEAFLVAKEDRKIDNSSTSDTSSPAATSADEAPKPVQTSGQNQTEEQTEKSEIPAAATAHPGTDKVDNSGAGRDDSSSVTDDSAPSDAGSSASE